jgi:hypothetical protein
MAALHHGAGRDVPPRPPAPRSQPTQISTRGVAKVNFFIYHTKWETHVRKIRGVAMVPAALHGSLIGTLTW